MNYHQTKIKRATKDYFCEKCHGIITCGTDYVDCATKTEDGWVHDRYHKDCNCTEKKDNNILDKVFNRLKSEGPFIMGNKGDKCTIQGITFTHTGKPFVICREWESDKVYYETVENFKNYIDWKGDTV